MIRFCSITCEYAGRRLISPLVSAYRHHETVAESAPALGSKPKSKRLSEFRKKLRETTPITDLGEQEAVNPAQSADPLPPWPDNTNPHTGEIGGPRGPEPTRYGDWERKGRVTDF